MQPWFRHDFAAHRDPKIAKIRRLGGYELVGIYWTLIEIIGENEDRRWNMSDLDTLAEELHIPEKDLSLAIAALIGGLLLRHDEATGFIWSNGTHRRMEVYSQLGKTLSEAGKKGAEKRWNGQKNSHPNGPAISPPNGVSIAEEKRREEKRTTPPTPPDPVGYEKLIDLWRSVRERESGKLDSLTDFEIKQLNSKFWGHGEEKISEAIKFLGEKRFHATLEQIDRYLKGERFESKMSLSGAQTPKTAAVPTFEPKPKRQGVKPPPAAEPVGKDDLPF